MGSSTFNTPGTNLVTIAGRHNFRLELTTGGGGGSKIGADHSDWGSGGGGGAYKAGTISNAALAGNETLVCTTGGYTDHGVSGLFGTISSIVSGDIAGTPNNHIYLAGISGTAGDQGPYYARAATADDISASPNITITGSGSGVDGYGGPDAPADGAGGDGGAAGGPTGDGTGGAGGLGGASGQNGHPGVAPGGGGGGAGNGGANGGDPGGAKIVVTWDDIPAGGTPAPQRVGNSLGVGL